MDATTGDWTLDSSRTRLHEYFLHRGIEVEYDMLEIGFPPDRVYQAQLEFEIDGKRYHSFYECDNKKMTQVLFTLRGYWEPRTPDLEPDQIDSRLTLYFRKKRHLILS